MFFLPPILCRQMKYAYIDQIVVLVTATLSVNNKTRLPDGLGLAKGLAQN